MEKTRVRKGLGGMREKGRKKKDYKQTEEEREEKKEKSNEAFLLVSFVIS